MPTATQQIPAGWRTMKISDICQILSGSTPKTSEKDYWDGDIPWFTPLDLSKISSRYVEQSERQITQNGFKACSAQKIPPHSLIMSSRAPIGYFAINLEEATTNQGCKTFVCSKEMNVDFLYYYLNQYLNEIKRLGSGSTFAEVGKKQLEGLEVTLPTLPEQTKIATILSKVDEELEKVEQIIGQTERLKTGLMQKLLTKGIGHEKFKETELGEIPEEWEVKTFKESDIDIIDGDRGVNYPKKNEFAEQGYCLFLSTKNIKNDKFTFKECSFITQEKDELLRKGKLEKFDVILTTRGTVGSVAYFNEKVPFENIRINSGMLIFRSRISVLPEFLYLLLKSPLMKKKYASVSSGSAQPQLPIRSLEQIKIPIPSKQEQEKITSILEASEELVYKSKKQKKTLLKLKKGLMADLLSGKVRVTIN